MSDSVNTYAALHMAERALAGIETSIRETQEFLSVLKQRMGRSDHYYTHTVVEMRQTHADLVRLRLAFEQNLVLFGVVKDTIVQVVSPSSTETFNQGLAQTAQKLRVAHIEIDEICSYLDHIIRKNTFLFEGGGVESIDLPWGAHLEVERGKWELDAVLQDVVQLRDYTEKRLELQKTLEHCLSDTNLPPPVLPQAGVRPVQFTAYWPFQVTADVKYGLYVYAHILSAIDEIKHDVKKFVDELGGDTYSASRTAKEITQLARGTLLTVIPECNDCEFSPPSLTKRWEDDWVRFGFDFKAPPESVNDVLFIRISIQVEGIEIAHIKNAIEVEAPAFRALPMQFEEQPSLVGESPPENLLARAKLETQTTKMYQKIFISYSRQDTAVTSIYRLVQIAAGNDVFIDTESIRSGENWRAALAEAIDEADIFQLFWSINSAQSPNVRDEWDYCLCHRCNENRCTEFIRPVYWEKPMPEPPEELAHLNFRFVPLGAADNIGHGARE